MDDLTRFEERFAARVQAFARSDVRAVDAATVAHAVAVGHPRSGGAASGLSWLRLDRRALAIALALGLLVVLMAFSVFVAGGRPSAIQPAPTSSPSAAPTGRPSAAPVVIGGLTTPREGEATATLADGRVLVLGGRGVRDGERAMLASAEIYDPATGRFQPTGSMSEARYQPLVATLHDGRVLVVGGRSETEDLASAEVYDPASGTFTTVGSMAHARSSCHCGINFMTQVRPTMTVLADGRVMIVGGRGAMSLLEPTGRADIFDPGIDRFTSSALIPCDATRGTVTGLLDGTALVTCRAGDSSAYPAASADWQPRAYLYDPASDTFAQTGAPTTDVSGFASLLPDGRVLLTGRGLRTSAAPAELYDPATRTFTPVTDGSVGSGRDTNASPSSVPLAVDSGIVLFLDRDVGGSLAFDPLSRAFTPIMLPWPMLSDAAADLGGGRVLLLPGSDDLDPPPDPRIVDLADLRGGLPLSTARPTP